MTIQEVIKSGLCFRRKAWNKHGTCSWFTDFDKMTRIIDVSSEDILATDWEVRPREFWVGMNDHGEAEVIGKPETGEKGTPVYRWIRVREVVDDQD